MSNLAHERSQQRLEQLSKRAHLIYGIILEISNGSQYNSGVLADEGCDDFVITFNDSREALQGLSEGEAEILKRVFRDLGQLTNYELELDPVDCELAIKDLAYVPEPVAA